MIAHTWKFSWNILVRLETNKLQFILRLKYRDTLYEGESQKSPAAPNSRVEARHAVSFSIL